MLRVVPKGSRACAAPNDEREAWHESGLTVFFLKKGWTNITPLLQHSKLALILDSIIAEAVRAKPGSGFSISLNGKIDRVYP